MITQGKWKSNRRRGNNEYEYQLLDENSDIFADIEFTDKAEAGDNARLIAAAPDLLAACEDLLGSEFLEQDPHSEWFICPHCGRDLPDDNGQPIPCDSDDCPGYKARQAITKATQ